MNNITQYAGKPLKSVHEFHLDEWKFLPKKSVFFQSFFLNQQDCVETSLLHPSLFDVVLEVKNYIALINFGGRTIGPGCRFSSCPGSSSISSMTIPYHVACASKPAPNSASTLVARGGWLSRKGER